jgi:hypothetical protein
MREKYPRSCRLYAFLTVLCTASLAAPAAAQSYTVLHAFELPPSTPIADLLGEAAPAAAYSTFPAHQNAETNSLASPVEEV